MEHPLAVSRLPARPPVATLRAESRRWTHVALRAGEVVGEVLESADTVKADGKPFGGGDERLRSEVVRLISDADEEARRFVSTACIADFNEMVRRAIASNESLQWKCADKRPYKPKRRKAWACNALHQPECGEWLPPPAPSCEKIEAEFVEDYAIAAAPASPPAARKCDHGVLIEGVADQQRGTPLDRRPDCRVSRQRGALSEDSEAEMAELPLGDCGPGAPDLFDQQPQR
ncbi:hypothetical protein M885DRAFT_545801 [Pelagophyceae sp. CCMP2097]|nr:hypothetical protein M885DRAFT_545801 [Pelagophyceae sp. CCMP2097]